jgi:plasmid stabilization system protein ParE
MRLELSRFVESDLDDIAGYIADDNPRRAVSFIQEIRAKFREIHHSPLLYQLRPDIGNGARMTTIGSYAILFRITNDAIHIERVVYGARGSAGDFPYMTMAESCLTSIRPAAKAQKSSSANNLPVLTKDDELAFFRGHASRDL